MMSAVASLISPELDPWMGTMIGAIVPELDLELRL